MNVNTCTPRQSEYIRIRHTCSEACPGHERTIYTAGDGVVVSYSGPDLLQKITTINTTEVSIENTVENKQLNSNNIIGKNDFINMKSIGVESGRCFVNNLCQGQRRV